MPTPGATSPWRKSSYSNGNGGNCVEVALGHAVGVRDTKDRDGGNLAVAPAAWTSLLTALRC
jgi:hypothetical protein